MTSKHEEVIELIGGDSTLTRLRAKQVQSCEDGVTFYVPLLGGIVGVKIVANETLWDVHLDIDPLSNMPKSIEEVPGHNLKVIIGHLFLV